MCLMFFACADNQQNADTSDHPTIIHQMQAHWIGKWPAFRVFSQTVDFYQMDTIISKQVWHEWMALPGRLRIDFHEKNSGSGMLFRNDSVYYFQEGQLVGSEWKLHPLLILADDVFFEAPEVILAKLAVLGFDVSKTSENDSVFIAGIEDVNDDSSAFFMVDKQNLWLRYVKYWEGDICFEVFMDDYFYTDGFPSEGRVSFYRDGQLVMVEKYFNVVVPAALEIELFSPGLWKVRTD